MSAHPLASNKNSWNWCCSSDVVSAPRCRPQIDTTAPIYKDSSGGIYIVSTVNWYGLGVGLCKYSSFLLCVQWLGTVQWWCRNHTSTSAVLSYARGPAADARTTALCTSAWSELCALSNHHWINQVVVPLKVALWLPRSDAHHGEVFLRKLPWQRLLCWLHYRDMSTGEEEHKYKCIARGCMNF